MSKNYYSPPNKCGFCGYTLDRDADYQNRGYHKGTPNCQSRHNQFLAKMRNAKKDPVMFVRDFAKKLEKNIENGLMTERDADPLISIVNIKKFFPMVGKPSKKKMKLEFPEWTL